MQPYNTLLGLSSLAEHSSGVIQTENEALTATCQRLLGIQRPSFADLNAVASRSLAALLLPCTRRQAPSIAAAAGNGSAGGRTRGGARGRPVWDSGSPTTPSAAAAGQQTAAAWDGTFGSGSRWLDEEPAGGSSRAGVGGAFDPFSDACDRLCSSASHHLLTLRGGPQLPPSSFDFTPFAWPSVLKDLKQWQLAGAAVEPGVGRGGGSALLDSNQALASLLVLRWEGEECGSQSSWLRCVLRLAEVWAGHLAASPVHTLPCRAGVTRLQQQMWTAWQTPHCIARRGGMLCRWRWLPAARGWAASRCWPLCSATTRQASAVARAAAASWRQMPAPARLRQHESRHPPTHPPTTCHSALQTPMAPVGRMLARARLLYDARAYMHQFERHGLSSAEVGEALESVAGLLDAYHSL